LYFEELKKEKRNKEKKSKTYEKHIPQEKKFCPNVFSRI